MYLKAKSSKKLISDEDNDQIRQEMQENLRTNTDETYNRKMDQI